MLVKGFSIGQRSSNTYPTPIYSWIKNLHLGTKRRSKLWRQNYQDDFRKGKGYALTNFVTGRLLLSD